MSPPLSEQLIALDQALDAASIAHAFGGAIALAYYTLEPRGTRDLDVNLFVDQGEAPRALAALPDEVTVSDAARKQILQDGQARLWWDETPVDVFFNTVAFHDQTAQHVQRVPFAGSQIPVLGPIELVVFKALFDRTKDWADIEAVAAAESVDVSAARAALIEFVGADDHRVARFDDAIVRGRATITS